MLSSAPNKFVTVHRPKQHSAGVTFPFADLVEPQPTEIELVRKLQGMGIRLKEYDYYNNRGDEKFMTINWSRR